MADPKKPSIPTYNGPDPGLNVAIAAIKENLELMNGSRPNIKPIEPVVKLVGPFADGNIDAVIEKINEVIDRINYTGTPK